MTYRCVLCDQEFKPEDKVTRCPNSITNAHTIEERWTQGERDSLERVVRRRLQPKPLNSVLS